MLSKEDLEELVSAGIISPDKAVEIDEYFRQQQSERPNRMLLAFGILGALLVGLGIILLLAHNWDQLSRVVKTMIAFVPVIISQGLVGYALWKGRHQRTRIESGVVLLILSVGACLALISQIYNIPGTISSFMITWVLLSAPLVYIAHSSMASLLVLVGVTYYGMDVGYDHSGGQLPYAYWGILAVLLPYYWKLIKEYPGSNFTMFHHWFFPASMALTLGTFGSDHAFWLFPAYLCLSLIWLVIAAKIPGENLLQNGYQVLGFAGVFIILLLSTFDFFWDEVNEMDGFFAGREFILTVALLILSVIASLLLKNLAKSGKWIVLGFSFLALFIFGRYYPTTAQVVANLALMFLGVVYLRAGASSGRLSTMNLGFLIIMAVVLSRFFDSEISFVLRGLIFVIMGLAFFAANYYMMKQKAT